MPHAHPNGFPPRRGAIYETPSNNAKLPHESGAVFSADNPYNCAGTFAENGFRLGEQLLFRRVHLETAGNNVVVGILRGTADRTHVRFMIPEAHRLPPLLRLIHL